MPSIKMNNKVNLSYPRKYWSSLMLFDNGRCNKLTQEYVNHAPAGALHEMEWADSIGSLPAEYNAMVNYYDFQQSKGSSLSLTADRGTISTTTYYIQTNGRQIYKKLLKEKYCLSRKLC